MIKDIKFAKKTKICKNYKCQKYGINMEMNLKIQVLIFMLNKYGKNA